MTWPRSVTRADLVVTHFRATGSGGQNVNKRDTACRIMHTPTGLSAECRAHREQLQNKREAFRKLADLLVPLMRAAAALASGTTAAELAGTSDERVRSIDLDLGRAIDHRLGKAHAISADALLDGDALCDLQTLVLLASTDDGA